MNKRRVTSKCNREYVHLRDDTDLDERADPEMALDYCVQSCNLAFQDPSGRVKCFTSCSVYLHMESIKQLELLDIDAAQTVLFPARDDAFSDNSVDQFGSDLNFAIAAARDPVQACKNNCQLKYSGAEFKPCQRKCLERHVK